MEHWVKWTYEASEWESHLQREWGRARSGQAKLAVMVSATALGGGVLIGLLDGDWPLGLGIGFGLAALFGVIPLLAMWYSYTTYRRDRKGPPKIMVGPQGVQLSQRWIPWGRALLRNVKLVQGPPPELRLELHGRSDLNGDPPSIRIPVPPDRMAEAQTLRERLLGLCL